MDRGVLTVGENSRDFFQFPHRRIDARFRPAFDPSEWKIVGRNQAYYLRSELHALDPSAAVARAVLRRGFDGEVIPLGSEDSNEIRVFHGDEIELPALPPGDPEITRKRESRIIVSRPADLFFHSVTDEWDGRFRGMENGVRWDLLLAQVFGSRQYVVPWPDFGRAEIELLDGTVVPAVGGPHGFPPDFIVPWGAVVALPEREGADRENWTGLDDDFRHAVEQEHAIGVTVLIDDVTPTPYTLTAADFARYSREDGYWRAEQAHSPHGLDARNVMLRSFLSMVDLRRAGAYNLDKVGIVAGSAREAYRDGDTTVVQFVSSDEPTRLRDGDTILLRRKPVVPQ